MAYESDLFEYVIAWGTLSGSFKRFRRTLDYPLDEQRRIVDYLNGLSERVNALPAPALSGRRRQVESQVELDALLPSVLRPSGGAFKGKLRVCDKEVI